MLTTLTASALLLATSYALPSSSANRELETWAATCTPKTAGSASTDDTPAISAAIKSCGAGGTIIIPAGSTYYLNTVLDFAGCSGCIFQLDGTLKFTSSTSYWNGKRAMISMTNIKGAKITSSTGAGVIDGNGQDSWDLFATDTTYARPTMLYISGGSDITIEKIRQKNPPNVFNSNVGGVTNVVYQSLKMDAVSKSINPPKNTDGFDVGSSTNTIIRNVKVLNDDDCVAFKAGCNLATVDTISCNGSHGLSVGSLGKTYADRVSNVYVTNAVMIDSTKAVGIKTYQAGSGFGSSTVSNVTFENVKVQNSDYAIQIQSCYGSSAKTCDNNAQLSGIVFREFSGTTSTKYAPTTSMIDCGNQGKCDLGILGYSVAAGKGTGRVLCANTPSTLGVACTAGANG